MQKREENWERFSMAVPRMRCFCKEVDIEWKVEGPFGMDAKIVKVGEELGRVRSVKAK